MSEFEIDEEESETISRLVFHRLMQKMLVESASQYGCRSDERKPRTDDFGIHASGRNTVRPIKALAPALPDSVHGSAYFSRGETGVLVRLWCLTIAVDDLGDSQCFNL